MIEVRLNGQDLKPVLAAPPKIIDQLNAVCRTLEVTVHKSAGLVNYIGQNIELWYNGARWFVGSLRKRRFKDDGSVVYTAHDPLYFFKKNPDDYYFKNMTATQAFKVMAEKSGVRVASLANTGVIFPALYYQGSEPDRVGTDLLARTYRGNGKKFWYRYRPDAGAEGLYLYERTVPTKLWAFQVGVNLVSATYEESIEDTITVVRLVDRETGKTVTKVNPAALKQYGPTAVFQEVDKEQAGSMDKKAKEMLDRLSQMSVNISAEGINPGRTMPQFFSSDIVYVEEQNTGLIGAYHIINVTHEFENDNIVRLGFDLQVAPDIPTIQYDDATKSPQSGASKTKAGEGTGVQQNYSDEVKKYMEKYGL